MKKKLVNISAMGYIKKDKIRDYQSNNTSIQTPLFFSKLISINRWEHICNFWHYSDKTKSDDKADSTQTSQFGITL
jgi:hypothetical protein